MSVNWSWEHKKGYLMVEQKPNDEVTWKGKVNIYEANCLGALIYDYKDKETKKDMYNFWGFWNDEKHLKNCLGLTKNYDGKKENIYLGWERVTKVVLNTYYKDYTKIANNFVKSGIKVELYYEEPKGAK